jgi:putative MATE family efflux protein
MQLSFDRTLSRRILFLAGPVVGAMLSQTLLNILDHILVGRLPDERESINGQAAVQASVILLWAVGGVLSAISVGTQALTARRFGNGDHEGAGKVLANSVAISLVLGLVCSLLFHHFAPQLLPAMKLTPTALVLGTPFLQWRYLAVLAMAVTASYKSFFDGLGQTYVHFVVAVVMNAVNILLNVGLIFGRFGLPRMGVEGSGLASCISSYLGMAIIIGWSFRRDLRDFHIYRLRKIDRYVMRELGRLSAPSGAAVWISLLGFGVFYSVVGKLDANAGNVHAIYQSATSNLINIFSVVFISCMAYGSATATLVGQSMGAHQFELAERYVYEAAKIGFTVFAALGLFTVAAPGAILHLWCKDPHVIEVAAPLLRMLGFFEPLACLALVFMYALYGAGNSRFVMLVELTLHLGCLIPLSYVLGITLGFGMFGMWGAMVAYVVLMAAIMSWKFSEGSWRHIRI